MKKLKAIYVHGYKGETFGNSFNLLKNYLENSIISLEYSLDYNYKNLSDAVKLLEETVKENNIDIIISTSLGSFISMSANVPGTFKTIINPCLDPVNEIPKLDPNTDIDRFSYFTKELEFENNMNCIGFFAIEDELFGDKFENKFFSITHGANIVHIDGGHSISKEGASEVASILKTIFNSYE